jgi:hypothetical protein
MLVGNCASVESGMLSEGVIWEHSEMLIGYVSYQVLAYFSNTSRDATSCWCLIYQVSRLPTATRLAIGTRSH